MTWIKTVKMEDDEQVRNAMMEQRKLYPMEYATPVPIVDHGFENGITGSHTLIPDALFHAFSTFGALMSPELIAARPARDDRDDGVRDEPMFLLNRIPRRVSASRFVKRRDGGGVAQRFPQRRHQ